MNNKNYILSRVSSTDEYDGIFFCYVEVDFRNFRHDLKKMRRAFSIAQGVTPVSSMDFPVPYSVKTFYLNTDESNLLEDLLEKHRQEQNQGFIKLKEPIAEDFLNANEGDATISKFSVRFTDETQAVFVGRYKHFSGEVQTYSICQDLLPANGSGDDFSNGDYKFLCSVCGSANVSGKCWADPNTDEVIDYISNEKDDNFCEDCGEHISLENKLTPTII